MIWAALASFALIAAFVIVFAIRPIVRALSPRRSEMQQQNARDGHPEHHGRVSQRGVVEDCHAQPTRTGEQQHHA